MLADVWKDYDALRATGLHVHRSVHKWTCEGSKCGFFENVVPGVRKCISLLHPQQAVALSMSTLHLHPN